jgi:methanogenesis imperfect marker protein 11
MEPLTDPYTITYPQITAVTDREGSRVELIEFFDCVGGAMWARHHYAQSPLVRDARCVGNSMRYLLEPGEVTLALSGSRFPAGISEVRVSDAEIQVSYLGMGGGGVGASICRAKAPGVARCRYDDSGGGRVAGASIWLPRRERVLIGVDDTDTPEAGATWTLAHNLARAVEDEQSRYLSHTIVQLYPVAFRTKNCVSTVCEFATADAAGLIARFRRLLEEYTLSPHTGMAVFRGFDPSPLGEFGWKAKRGQVSEEDLHRIRDADLSIILSGRGKVGAVAALPFYTRFEEALELCSG